MALDRRTRREPSSSGATDGQSSQHPGKYFGWCLKSRSASRLAVMSGEVVLRVIA